MIGEDCVRKADKEKAQKDGSHVDESAPPSKNSLVSCYQHAALVSSQPLKSILLGKLHLKECVTNSK